MCYGKKQSRFERGVVLGVVAATLLGVGAARAEWTEGGRLPDLVALGAEGRVPSLAGKVVLVDFWASWCGPCKKSFPVLEALHTRYAEQGLVVLGISVDEDAEAMRSFLSERAASFPVVRDARQRLVEDAAVEAMPTSFLIDRTGVIRHVHVGFLGGKTATAYAEEIERLLKDSGPAVAEEVPHAK